MTLGYTGVLIAYLIDIERTPWAVTHCCMTNTDAQVSAGARALRRHTRPQKILTCGNT